MRSRASRRWPELTLMLVALVVSTGWFRTSGLIWGVDSGLPLDLHFVDAYFRVPDSGVGAPDVRKLAFLVPWGTILAAWHAIGLPYSPEVAERMLVFGLLSVAGISMIALIREMWPWVRPVALLGGGLVYTYNVATLVLEWSNLSNLVFHSCLLPAVVLFWIRALRSGGRRNLATAVLVWLVALSPAYITTPVVVLDFALLGVITIVFAVVATDRHKRIGVFVRAACMSVVWAIANLYWILPLGGYASAESTRGYATGDQAKLFLLNSVSLPDALRFNGFWGLHAQFKASPYFGWVDHYDGLVNILAFVVPVLAVVGAVYVWRRGPSGEFMQVDRLREHKALAVGMGFVALLAIFMCGRTFGWLDDLKISALDLVGLRDPFRSAYARFMPYVTLAMVPLFAVGLHALAARTLGLKHAPPWLRSFSAFVPAMVIVVCAAIIPGPLVSGAYLEPSGILPSHRVTLPSDYERVAKMINGTGGEFNVAALPAGPGGLVPLDWQGGKDGYIGSDPLRLMTAHSFVALDPSSPRSQKGLTDIASGVDVVEHAEKVNVRFVVLHRDRSAAYLEGEPGWVGTDVGAIERRLDFQLLKVYDGQDLLVYRVQDWRATGLYARSVTDPDSMRAVDYQRTWDGYKIAAGQIEPSEELVINQPYDAGWKVRGGERVASSDQNIFRQDPDRVLEFTHTKQREMVYLYALTLAIIFALTGMLAAPALRRRFRKDDR